MMNFELVHPPITPRYIRYVRFLDQEFLLPYLYEWRAFVPAHQLAAAIGVDYRILMERFGNSSYLRSYWANILLPDELGNEEQTACLDITALPLQLIAINLTGDENELLNALCDEALLALAEHLHLGSRNTILRNRIDLMQDVADTLHQQRAGRGEAG